jgi:hypothetical protein
MDAIQSPLKLPRQIEADPRCAQVQASIDLDRKVLWEGGKLLVTHLAFTPALRLSLEQSIMARRLERGLEKIETILRNEEKGLAALRTKEGTQPARRISRLFLMEDNGTERFYRSCESLLRKHSDRVLGIRVTSMSGAMVETIFGRSSQVKAILISDKNAVSNVLLSLAAPSVD